MKIKFGPINVNVVDNGIDMPEWYKNRGSRRGKVYRYKVTVSCGNVKYSCTAWGSIHDFEKAKRDYEGIGATVVDELMSARCDPKEFTGLVVGEKEGFERTRALGTAKRVCAAAAKFSFEDLEKAIEVIEAKGLR